MRDLKELREELDSIDRELVSLFIRRMGVSGEVAEYKQAAGMPVLDAGREEKVLETRMAMTEDRTIQPYVRELFVEIMRLSRELQSKKLTEAEVK